MGLFRFMSMSTWLLGVGGDGCGWKESLVCLLCCELQLEGMRFWKAVDGGIWVAVSEERWLGWNDDC